MLKFQYLIGNNNEFYFISLCTPMYSRVYVQKGYMVSDLIDIWY